MSSEPAPPDQPVAPSAPPAEATRLQDRFPVSYAIFAMARSHRAIAAAKLAELDLFPNQEIMLAQLAGSDGVPQKVLAQTLRISHVSVAKSVARMERAGLVTRSPSPDDGRVSLVCLTEDGEALHRRAMQVWAELDQITTRALDDQTRAGFLAGVEAIRAALETGGDERVDGD